jgi:hypothetical protein
MAASRAAGRRCRLPSTSRTSAPCRCGVVTCARDRRVTRVQYLISAGADVNAHNSKFMKGYTPLHFAIGRANAVSACVCAIARVDVRSVRARAQLTAAVDLLLAAPKLAIDSVNANGASALHLAALWGSTICVYAMRACD